MGEPVREGGEGLWERLGLGVCTCDGGLVVAVKDSDGVGLTVGVGVRTAVEDAVVVTVREDVVEGLAE